MNKQFTLDNELTTKAFAEKLAQLLQPGDTLALSGPLGSGKTTFTRYLAQALGVKGPIKSPTYTIIKSYPLSEGNLTHMDAYRLEETGADAIDMEAIFQPDTIAVIEWAQFIDDQMPNAYLELAFSLTDEFFIRSLTLSQHGKNPRLETIIEEMAGGIDV